MKKSVALSFIWFFLMTGLLPAQDMLKQMHSNVTEKINGKEYYIHTIKKGQTLYMISKAYGVDVNDIIRENPEVKEGIRADQKIRIPTGRQDEPQKKQPKNPPAEKKEIVPVPQPVEEPVVPCGQETSGKKKVYNVALMIPLYLNEVTGMDVENLPSNPEEDYAPLRFIQFYEGVRIALDSLQKTGLSIRLYTYDVDKDTVKTRRLLKNPDLKEMDLIIGLLYNKNFQIVSDFADKNDISIVNPISERTQIIANHPEVFKVMPSTGSQYSELADVFKSKFPESNILIVRNGQYRDKDAAATLNSECGSRQIDSRIVEGYGAAIDKLSKDRENVIVIFSESKAYALDLITKINELRNDYRITLVGLPRWDKIEGLESDYLVNLRVHMMAPDFIDYDDPGVKRFVKEFQARYKTDPDPLAFQGFDIANYFLNALNKYGHNFGRCIPDFRMKSLQTDFHFIQSKGNGFENRHWEIYEYDNYRLRKAAAAN
jgi:LysM repeat protein/ABC-type branched-subunit amino acid transport system substrate-binding protein